MAPVLIGIVMGVVCATPMLYVLREAVRDDVQLDFGRVLVCGLAPFMVLQIVLLVAWLLRPQDMLSFGSSTALSFLAVVTVGGLSAWRHMP